MAARASSLYKCKRGRTERNNWIRKWWQHTQTQWKPSNWKWNICSMLSLAPRRAHHKRPKLIFVPGNENMCGTQMRSHCIGSTLCKCTFENWWKTTHFKNSFSVRVVLHTTLNAQIFDDNKLEFYRIACVQFIRTDGARACKNTMYFKAY